MENAGIESPRFPRRLLLGSVGCCGSCHFPRGPRAGSVCRQPRGYPSGGREGLPPRSGRAFADRQAPLTCPDSRLAAFSSANTRVTSCVLARSPDPKGGLLLLLVFEGSLVSRPARPRTAALRPGTPSPPPRGGGRPEPRPACPSYRPCTTATKS